MARKKRRQERDIQAENRKHILRERKERRERQVLLAVLGPVLAVALGIFAYGGFRELYLEPHRPVARAEGQTITVAQFGPRLQWYRRQMLNNLQSFMQFASTSDPSFLVNLAEQQRQGAAEATVDQLIDEILIRVEAERRGIEVTEADVDERIRNDLATLIAPPTTQPAEEELTITGTVTAAAPTAAISGTVTAGTPTAAITHTATAISTQRIGEEFRLTLQPVLDQVGLSVAAYRNIVRHAIYRERLGENMVPAVQKQIEAAYLRFTSQETAQKAAAALKAGAAWDAVVEQFRQPTATPENPPAAAATVEPASTLAPTTGDAADASEATATTRMTEAATDTPEATATARLAEKVANTPKATTTARRTAMTSPRTAAARTAVAPRSAAQATGSPEAKASLSPSGSRGANASARPSGSPGTQVSPTPASSPTPAQSPTPTATPEPYASDIGERSWLTRFDILQQWSLDDAGVDAVMGLAKMSSGGPYKAAGNMWYVVYVFDSAEEREVPKERLDTLRDQAVNDWVSKRKEEVKPDKFTLEGVIPEEPPWFVDAWERLFPTTKPTATVQLGTLVVPTGIAVTGAAPQSAPTGAAATVAAPQIVATVVVPGTPAGP